MSNSRANKIRSTALGVSITAGYAAIGSLHVIDKGTDLRLAIAQDCLLKADEIKEAIAAQIHGQFETAPDPSRKFVTINGEQNWPKISNKTESSSALNRCYTEHETCVGSDVWVYGERLKSPQTIGAMIRLRISDLFNSASIRDSAKNIKKCATELDQCVDEKVQMN